MKKIFLSSFIIFTFASYTLYGRILNSSLPVTLVTGIVKPSIPQTNIKDDNIGYEVIPPKPTPVPVTTPKPTPTPISKPAPIPVPTPIPAPVVTGLYRNGRYTGSIADAYYGNVQVVAVISGGEISDVQFLDYPKDRQTSLQKSMRAMPILISEAIAIQDSNVDTVSGASFTSTAYRESLASALAQAKI